jgi:predicted ATP-grasp superfamily ATP-dependent carboligase
MSSVGRAIVTYARSWQALAAIRSLGRRGIEVVACDEVAITPGGLSRYAVERFAYPSPAHEPEAFIEAMLDAVDCFRPLSSEAPYVLLPIHAESYLLARHAERFRGRILLPLSSVAAFEAVQHKGRLVELAQRLGVPTPATWSPTDLAELELVLDELSFPVFVKMPTFSSAVGVHKVETPAELRAVFADLLERYQPLPQDYPLIQELIAGDDYCTSGLFNEGQLRASLTYKNVLSFPRDRGPGVVRETVAAPELDALAAKLLGELRWHGMAQVDFRWTGLQADTPQLIEVNPRFFGGLFQAIESGVDYPWLLFRLAVDGDINPPGEVSLGLRTETPITGLLATLSELVEHDSKLDELERAWKLARRQLEHGEALTAVRAIVEGLRVTLDVEGRLERVRQVLEENRHNVSFLLEADDPLPVLGMIYPLTVFLRRGEVSADVLIGLSGDSV